MSCEDGVINSSLISEFYFSCILPLIGYDKIHLSGISCSFSTISTIYRQLSQTILHKAQNLINVTRKNGILARCNRQTTPSIGIIGITKLIL